MSTSMHYHESVFVWDKKFERRRREACHAEEKNLIQGPNENAVAAFLSAQGTRLDPPDHNYTAPQAFLEPARDSDLIRSTPLSQDRKVTALVDERSDTTGWLDVIGNHHSARDWEAYASYPPEGNFRPSAKLNACDLYRKLQTSVRGRLEMV